MFTPYDREQQNRERQRIDAQRELALFDKSRLVPQHTNWDKVFAPILAPPPNSSPRPAKRRWRKSS